ncbi:D-aminoacyl-tRNA deacylase [Gracilibacillus thailandensis]|uniref:D-aminoacyl-tRNA deacylase n=1 Tax=Gracilibacillus thailandensis TaxID=563735 RepID=A0A6N7QZK7_9BACI|nr:D-aminoacyl-tRNA deacylase [Gracilibacillus thailandensis]MRI67508.1 D-tyrosyl-tRNA(Tyr) deacylase [Gracilibacillus thailandensis]
MKVVLQRVKEASVTVDNQVVGQIENGYVALVGVTHEDTEEDVNYLVNKTINLRIFEDENQKMNLSLKDVGGSVLSISQFTLYGDARKGRRPNFMKAAKPDVAENLYEQYNQKLRAEGINVQTGQFGATMNVSLTNNGPVTMILESGIE